MTIERRTFADKPTLAKELAEAVADRIRAAIETRGLAAIAVSGGSTPARFFQALGKTKDIDWSRVIVTLVDERWVDETNDRSNALLVNERMLQGPAAIARFFPLYSGGDEPDPEHVAKTNSLLAELPEQFAAVVLGMGSDGHVASLFPSTNPDPADPEPIRQITPDPLPPEAPFDRITLTIPALLNADEVMFVIRGNEKLALFESATRGENDLPVARLLGAARQKVTCFA